MSKYGLNVLLDFKPEDSPMRPEATAILRAARSRPSFAPLPALVASDCDSVWSGAQHCPDTRVDRHDSSGRRRNPPDDTDGRKLPDDPQPAWYGYSTGKWEGDTLVVETAGFNDKSWLDAMGHPHSEEMRVTERFRRRDFGHMDVETTIDDPNVYARLFTIKVTQPPLPDSDILEYFCAEGEKTASTRDRKGINQLSHGLQRRCGVVARA